MKWIRRGLMVLLAIPLAAAALLLVLSQREDAGRTTVQVEIGRPPSEVFLHIQDPQLLQQWTGLTEIELLDGPPVRVGSRARAALVARGQRTELESEVTAMERDRLFTFVLRTAGAAPVGFTQLSRFALDENDGRTRLSVTADTSYEGVVARLFEPLMTPLAQGELERQIHRLKAQVEASAVLAEEASAP